MKLIISAIMLVVLSACGQAKADTPVKDTADPDELFITAVNENAPLTKFSPDEDLIELAHSYCEGYDSGLTTEQYALVAMESGLDAETAGIILGAAVAVYCPEHEGKI